MDITEAEKFLEKMDKLFTNKREKYESVLDYVVDKHVIHDSRKNQLLQIEGEIAYYQKIYDDLINETSKLSYFLSSEQPNHDSNNLLSSVSPTGEGGKGHMVRVVREEEDGRHQKVCADISKRAGDILVMVTQKIDTLKQDYEKSTEKFLP